MLRFIFLCMGIFIFSFTALPIYYGISGAHEELDASQTLASEDNETLSFKEIYAIADKAQAARGPQSLNNLAPAAGGASDKTGLQGGFRQIEDSALADEPEVIPETEEGADEAAENQQ